jgi:L-alanine-DL-glutamate epimerase-like enolase superfamily enzyme
MKVVAVDSAVLAVPTPRPMALEFREHRLVVAHVRTDEGVAGLGYGLAFGGGGAEAVQVYLEMRLAPLLVGEDPRLVERLWERMYRADPGIRRLGVAAYALSALDIALWDLVGKAAGQPLYLEYMDWMPPDLFEDVPRPDPADGLVRIPDRPGHGMALVPGAERKYRLR